MYLPPAPPTSVQFAAFVLLIKTPTSVPTYTSPADPSTTTASAGASERFPEKSVHVSPAFVVLNTCPTWNPIIVTYAVCPVVSEGSMAIDDTGNSPGLIVPVRSTITDAPALVVTNTCPPGGFVPAPEASVPA